MTVSNVTSKGQVTVPAEMRLAVGIKPGGKVRFVRRGRAVLIEAVEEQPLSSVFGILKAPRGRSVPDGAEVSALAADAVAKKFRRARRR